MAEHSVGPMPTSRIWSFEVCETPTPATFNPYHRATTNWRAVCGRTARTVRREGSPAQPDFPTPIRDLLTVVVSWRRSMHTDAHQNAFPFRVPYPE